MAILSLVVVVEDKSMQASCLGRRVRAWDQARFATSLYLSPPPFTSNLASTRATAVHWPWVASELHGIRGYVVLGAIREQHRFLEVDGLHSESKR